MTRHDPSNCLIWGGAYRDRPTKIFGRHFLTPPVKHQTSLIYFVNRTYFAKLLCSTFSTLRLKSSEISKITVAVLWGGSAILHTEGLYFLCLHAIYAFNRTSINVCSAVIMVLTYTRAAFFIDYSLERKASRPAMIILLVCSHMSNFFSKWLQFSISGSIYESKCPRDEHISCEPGLSLWALHIVASQSTITGMLLTRRNYSPANVTLFSRFLVRLSFSC